MGERSLASVFIRRFCAGQAILCQFMQFQNLCVPNHCSCANQCRQSPTSLNTSYPCEYLMTYLMQMVGLKSIICSQTETYPLRVAVLLLQHVCLFACSVSHIETWSRLVVTGHYKSASCLTKTQVRGVLSPLTWFLIWRFCLLCLMAKTFPFCLFGSRFGVFLEVGLVSAWK